MKYVIVFFMLVVNFFPVLGQINQQVTSHYYTSKKVSVKIMPWQNQTREIIFLDTLGHITYKLVDESKSTGESSTTTLYFKANGSVLKSITSYNPGASMYWNETTITFSDNNIPTTRTSVQQPMQTIKIPVVENWDPVTQQWKTKEVVTTPVRLQPVDTINQQSPLLWDEKNKKWIKQEVIECQPVPNMADTSKKETNVVKTEKVKKKRKKTKRKK